MPRAETSETIRAAGSLLGRQIAVRRHYASRSAEHVAVTAGISVDTIRRIEQGRVPNPGVFTILAIARSLGIGLDELIGFDETNPAA